MEIEKKERKIEKIRAFRPFVLFFDLGQRKEPSELISIKPKLLFKIYNSLYYNTFGLLFLPKQNYQTHTIIKLSLHAKT